MSGKYSPYEKYQESELDWLGPIPESWDLRRLGSFFNERRTKVSDQDYPALSVTMMGIVPQLETAAKTKDGDNRKLVREGDFVINSRSDRKGSSGISPFDGSVSLICIVLEPVGIHPAFVHHLLRSEAFQEEFYRFGKGIVADLWSTNYSAMKNILIPIPSVEEQTQIAGFLDYETAKIDALIEKQQLLIELLNEKRQAVISHAVTRGLNPDAPMRDSGVEWLGEVPAHWTATTLKHHARVIDCKHITADFVDEGYPLASIGEVKGWRIDLTSAKKTTEKFYKVLIEGNRKPKAGDIIYTRNATVGEAAIVEAQLPMFAMGQDVCLIRPNESIAPEFLLHCLKSPVVFNQLSLAMVGATFKRINVDAIRNFSITLPPAQEQTAIVADLSRILPQYDSLIAATESTVTLLQERRAALISAAVTGKIDVRGWKAPAGEAHSAATSGLE